MGRRVSHCLQRLLAIPRELNLDDGRFEECLCGKDECRLVWGSKPDPETYRETCAELRHLHEKMEISEETMFSLSQPGKPAEEITVARRLVQHDGERLPECPEYGHPMIMRHDPESGRNILKCSNLEGCNHAGELPEDQRMRETAATGLPGLEE